MLCHTSNISLQIIFSISMPHIDTPIEASKVSNSIPHNEARKWLLIAYCFENHLSLIAILEEMTSMFCQSFMGCGQLVYHLLMPPQNCHASCNDLFSHSCLKVSTNSSNSTLIASLSTAIDPSFVNKLSNHCYDIAKKTSSSLK